MLRAWRRWMRVNTLTVRSNRARHPRLEGLEDRALPAFVTAPVFSVNYLGASKASRPAAVASGDFNNDGKLDIATANQNSNAVSIMLGNGAGGFGIPTGFNVLRNPTSILSVDLNRDGKIDLVTANKDDDAISVILNNGGGNFRAPVHITVGDAPAQVASGDFNGDQKPDLAVANSGANTVTVLFGNGTGGFTLGGTVTVGNNPTSVAVADFNNDGKADLASVSGGFGHLDVNLNNGDGTFGGKLNYETGFVATAVAVGDFNGDHQPDLAVACGFPSNDGVSILLGNPNGTFQTFAEYGVGGQTPAALTIGDFNGDGAQDIVTANGQFANNSVSVLMGLGNGTFGTVNVYTAAQNPSGVATGDFNGDGSLDVVAANNSTIGSSSGVVSMMLGNGDGTLQATPNLVLNGAGPAASADLTGDGIPELAVVTSSGEFSGVTIYPGMGHGAFGLALRTTTIQQPKSLTFARIDGDAVLDLVVSTNTGVTILIGNGDGTFGTRWDFAAGSSPNWVAVADFNADTFADLAVANDSGTNGVSVLLGNGDGTFGAATSLAAGGAANFLVAGDLNADSKPDLAVLNGSSNRVSVLFGQGNGNFGTPFSFTTRNGPGSVSIGDFNRDNKVDIAVPTFFGTNGNSGLAIYQQGAGGSFGLVAEYGVPSRPLGSAVTDFNGDGKLDLVTVNNFADSISIFNGSGFGSFGNIGEYTVGDRPSWVTAADFNGDGMPDLAVVNSNSGTITLLQTPLPASRFRVTVVPDSVNAGGAFQVTVAAVDANNRLVPGFTGAVTFTSTDLAAVLPARYTFTTADRGVHRFNVTLKTAGTQDLVANLAGAPAGSDSVTVAPAALTGLKVTTTPGPVAGAAFEVTVQAADPFGNVISDYQGTVHFSTDDVAGFTLPDDYTFTPGDNGIHTFSGGAVLHKAGLRTISVLATDGLRGSAAVSLQAAEATRLVLGTSTVVTAGKLLAVKVTARDAFDNVATGYRGMVHLAGTDANASLPGDYAFTAGDAGAHTFQTILRTAGTHSLTVSAAGVEGGTQGGIQVRPGATVRLAFLQQPTGTFVATRFGPPVRVQARDAFGNAAAPGTLVSLRLLRNPVAALLRGNVAFADANGVATFAGLTINKPGRGFVLGARVGAVNSPASAAFNIFTANHFRVILRSGPRVQAGTTFAVTVIALDPRNRTDTAYTGKVHFSSSSPLANLPADYTFTAADRGVKTFMVTLNSAGVRSLVVADMIRATMRAQANVTILPGAVSTFQVAGYPTTTIVNVANTFTVTAVDTFGNTVTGYLGSVQFSNTGGTAVLPEAYTFTAVDQGRREFSATFQTVGDDQSLTVTDTIDTSLTGTEDGISVTPEV